MDLEVQVDKLVDITNKLRHHTRCNPIDDIVEECVHELDEVIYVLAEEIDANV